MHLIRLLGGISLEDTRGHVTGRAAQRRRLALLALLAAEHPRPLSRDKLVGLLWAESDDERARHLLRDTLYVLRKSLGEDAIVSSGDEIRLNPEHVRCDLWEFNGALDRGNPAAAVALYTGPFLDGVYLDDAAEFERWAELERARLARRWAEAVQSLAEHSENAGDAAAAAEWWRRLYDADPSNTTVSIRLMRALVAADQRAAALRHAAAHNELLAAEFGLEPDAELSALAEQLRHEKRAGLTSSRLPDQPVPIATVTSPDPAPALPRAPRRRIVLASVLLLAVTAVAALGVRARNARQAADQRIVVMPLENRTGDPALAVVGSIAADWIIQGLVATGEVHVVPFATALHAARYLANNAAAHSAVHPAAIGEETGASIVVLGSYARDGDSLRFQVTVTDIAAGRVLAAPELVSAAVSEPLNGIEALRGRVVAELATTLNPQLRQHTTGASRPPTYAAYRAYAEATSHVVEGNWTAALEPLREAARDTTFKLPVVVLGMMHFNLGDYAAADSIVRLAMPVRQRLAVTDRALLDMLSAWLRREHEAAYRAARTASTLAPGSMTTAQMAIEAQRINRPREAIRILTSLDPTRGELRGDPYYWWGLTLAHHQLQDYRRELAAVKRARDLSLNHAVILTAEVRALAALGRPDEVARAIDAALAQPGAGSTADMLFRHAVQELEAHGQPAAARRVADRALSSYATSAAKPDRLSHARVLYLAGRWTEAAALFTELARQSPQDITLQGYLGVIAARQGRRAEAERIAGWLASVRQPYAWAAPTQWRAAIAAQLGDRRAAIALLRQAISQGALRDGLHSDPALAPLRKEPAFRDLLKPQG